MANLIEIDEQIMRDVKRGIALSGSRLAFARKINVEQLASLRIREFSPG